MYRNQKSYQPASQPASQPAILMICVLIQRKPTFFIVSRPVPAQRSPSNVVFCNKYSGILLFWLKKFVCSCLVPPSFYHHFFESCLGKTYIRCKFPM